MGMERSDEGCVIRVRWSEYTGYVIMQNPLDGKVYFVESKGLPRWVFDRIPNPDQPKEPPRAHDP